MFHIKYFKEGRESVVVAVQEICEPDVRLFSQSDFKSSSHLRELNSEALAAEICNIYIPAWPLFKHMSGVRN